jgi:hypothetical protein
MDGRGAPGHEERCHWQLPLTHACGDVHGGPEPHPRVQTQMALARIVVLQVAGLPCPHVPELLNAAVHTPPPCVQICPQLAVVLE